MSLTLFDGTPIPAVGQGTWRMGESPGAFAREVEALRLGVELGLTLIDTAEMYAAGQAERVVAAAIRDIRDKVFLVSKVWPNHARAPEVREACLRSLERLGVDRLDAYLIHWPTLKVPLEETIEALVGLVASGHTRYVGVSNFPTDWMERALAAARRPLAFDQVPYSLARREAEGRLLPYLRRHGVVLMAYRPLKDLPTSGSGRQVLEEVARALGETPEVVALAWLVHQEGVVAIPKAASPEHVRTNARALTLEIPETYRRRLAAAFPPKAEELPLQTMD